MAPMDHLAQLAWRTSSFTDDGCANGDVTCVQTAAMPDGRVAVRNSNATEAGVVLLTRAEMAAWLQGVKAGEFDDLV